MRTHFAAVSLDARNRWGAPVLARKRRNVGKYIGKQQWIEYLKQPFLRQPFMSFSLCKLDESVKVLKLLCGEWKEVIF